MGETPCFESALEARVWAAVAVAVLNRPLTQPSDALLLADNVLLAFRERSHAPIPPPTEAPTNGDRK